MAAISEGVKSFRHGLRVHHRDGHGLPLQQFRRFQPPLAGDQAILGVDHDGVKQADRLQRLGQLFKVAKVFAMPDANLDARNTSCLHGKGSGCQYIPAAFLFYRNRTPEACTVPTTKIFLAGERA